LSKRENAVVGRGNLQVTERGEKHWGFMCCVLSSKKNMLSSQSKTFMAWKTKKKKEGGLERSRGEPNSL